MLNSTGNRTKLVEILKSCASQWYSAESKVLNTFKALEPTRSSGFFGSWSKEADEQRIAAYNSCIQLISGANVNSLTTDTLKKIEKDIKGRMKQKCSATDILEKLANSLKKFGDNADANKVFVALCSSKTLKQYGTRAVMAESAKILTDRPKFITETQSCLAKQSQPDIDNKNDAPNCNNPKIGS